MIMGSLRSTSHRPRSRARGVVAISTAGLTKVFGTRKAVDSVNLEVKTGEVFGFLGPNGAGKTTTINMILGLARPTSGHVEIFGQKVSWRCSGMRRHVGSLLDGVQLYPYLSARENLQVFANALYGISGRRIDEVLSLVDLSGRARDRVRGYSHGMRRRLALAVALLHDPDILILDEPANGLDPAGIKEMRDLVKALADDGKAVFLSSHLLHEVEIICDRVAILRQGAVLAQGGVDELLSRVPTVELAVDRPDDAERVLLAQPGVSGVRRDGERLVVEYAADMLGEASGSKPGKEAYRAYAGRLNATLASQGIFAYEVRPHHAGLENVFFEVLEEVSRNGNPGGRAD